ncbi:MAG: TolC family protein [Saprospiraceae bacterium]
MIKRIIAQSALMLMVCLANAQIIISLDSVEMLALHQHPRMQLAQQNIEDQRALKKGSFNLENPDVWLESPSSTYFTPGISQRIASPFSYVQQSRLGNQNVLLAQKGLSMSKAEVLRQARMVYLNLQYAETKVKQLAYQDSLFNNLYSAALRRYNAGDAGLLEKVTAETEYKEIHNSLLQAQSDFQNAQIQVQLITGMDTNIILSLEDFQKNDARGYYRNISDSTSKADNPLLQYYLQNIQVNKQSLRLEKSKVFPGISLGYLNQGAKNSEVIYRFQVGLSVPIWFWTYHAQIKSAELKYQMARTQYSLASLELNSEYQQALTDFNKYSASLGYYESTALALAESIINTATKSFGAGQISYIVFTQSLNQAFEIKQNYYEALKNYNQSIIQLNYLNGL